MGKENAESDSEEEVEYIYEIEYVEETEDEDEQQEAFSEGRAPDARPYSHAESLDTAKECELQFRTLRAD